MSYHFSISRPERGYTIVELALAMTIIGLLAGSILIARDLVASAETRLISRELARYQSAYLTFRDKYNALPGDMNNAAQIWGAADGSNGNSANCPQNATTDTTTCNGDGNGVIMTSNATYPQNESQRAWQHLKNSGLVEGPFVGTVDGLANPGLALGQVFMASRANGAGYQFYSDPKGWANAYEGNGGIQAIRVAGLMVDAAGLVQLGSPSFSGYQVFTIDEKVDDSKPGTGKIFVPYSVNNCLLGGNDVNAATYNAANETISCFFHYDLTK